MADYRKSDSIRILITLCALLAAVSCGKKDDAEPVEPPAMSAPNLQTLMDLTFTADRILPDGNGDIVRTDSVSVLRPDSAEAFLGELAEHYIACNFVGLAATTYRVASTDISVEAIQFAELDNAYGFYAGTRPNGVKILRLGAESYRVGNSQYFTQGEYVVVMSVEHETEAAYTAMMKLGKAIDSIAGKPPMVPLFFMLFPYEFRLPASAKQYTYNFLGMGGIDQVYTIDYGVNGDTATLFLTPDKDGSKFLLLKQYAQSVGTVREVPRGVKFEDSLGFVFEHPEAGGIIFGVARGKVVGCVDYKDLLHRDWVAHWLRGLQM